MEQLIEDHRRYLEKLVKLLEEHESVTAEVLRSELARRRRSNSVAVDLRYWRNASLGSVATPSRWTAQAICGPARAAVQSGHGRGLLSMFVERMSRVGDEDHDDPSLFRRCCRSVRPRGSPSALVRARASGEARPAGGQRRPADMYPSIDWKALVTTRRKKAGLRFGTLAVSGCAAVVAGGMLFGLLGLVAGTLVVATGLWCGQSFEGGSGSAAVVPTAP